MNVLVVEDEHVLGMILRETLRDYGHVPILTTSVCEALPRLSEADVALLDIELVGETSFFVADRLIEKDVPFAFICGNPNCLTRRYRNFPRLVKPFTGTDVENVLGQMRKSR
jgi:DNA-binding response OmpR family regulator